MRTRILETEQFLPLGLHKVFAFFSDAHNLDAITPPWLHFQVLTPRPIEMRVGALIDYKLRVRWLPLTWRTEIVDWDPPRRFVDIQRRGPYKLWRHEHRFEEREGGVLIHDRVEYAVPGWIFEPILHRLFVGPDVRKIFAFRRRRIWEILLAEGEREQPAGVVRAAPHG